jgi:hypothetical protein
LQLRCFVGQPILAAAGFQPASGGFREHVSSLKRGRLKGGCGQNCQPHCQLQCYCRERVLADGMLRAVKTSFDLELLIHYFRTKSNARIHRIDLHLGTLRS